MKIAILLMLGNQVLIDHNANRTDFYPASSVKLFVAGYYFSQGIENGRHNYRDLKHLITVSANRPYKRLVKYVGSKKITKHIQKVTKTDAKICSCLCRCNRTSIKALQRYLKYSLRYEGLRRWLSIASSRRRHYIQKTLGGVVEVYGKSGTVKGLWQVENLLIKRRGKEDIMLSLAIKYSYAGCKTYACIRHYTRGYVMSLLKLVKIYESM